MRITRFCCGIGKDSQKCKIFRQWRPQEPGLICWESVVGLLLHLCDIMIGFARTQDFGSGVAQSEAIMVYIN
jgi:hypothetical protein